MRQHNSPSSDAALEHRFEAHTFAASGEVLAKARALIAQTRSVEMSRSFEQSLAELPEPRAMTVLVGV